MWLMRSQGGGSHPCSAQPLTWALITARRGGSKGEECTVQSCCETRLWQSELPRLSHTAVPSCSSCRAVVRRLGDPQPCSLQGCAGGGCQGTLTAGPAKPGGFWALLHAFPAGAGGSRRDSSGCSQPGCSPSAPSQEQSRPSVCPSSARAVLITGAVPGWVTGPWSSCPRALPAFGPLGRGTGSPAGPSPGASPAAAPWGCAPAPPQK